MTKPSSKEQETLARDIAKGLDKAWSAKDTEEVDVDLATARIVIFSDHHKGARDGADDFQRCEPAYAAAMAYYFEEGYSLVVLGDGEELWENPPEPVVQAYKETLALEARFNAGGRYFRFWGNHDDQWRHPHDVKKLLGPIYGDLKVREALKWRVTRGGEHLGTLFLVHGHQGTASSDRFAFFSKWVVRNIWRPIQRKVNFASTTPARDWELRARHDAAMFEWARKQRPGVLLICGHTHRPVFWDSAPENQQERTATMIEGELQAARERGDEEAAARLTAELEYVRAESRRKKRKPIKIDPPCYFNTGCCSFGDGDVTGLEIADGEIRLVRWPLDDGTPAPKLLAHADLATVLHTISAAP